ncbi:Uncharacterized vacuolar membrane protein YGR125W [Durusdinium trenchii]|uniref:Uncharacterized vacuolar membrane protein YGR125W n=1 Tax=Durusdinium trenchii TaxID=1381693 RepID=A0ABP0QPF0_9DINO
MQGAIASSIAAKLKGEPEDALVTATWWNPATGDSCSRLESWNRVMEPGADPDSALWNWELSPDPITLYVKLYNNLQKLCIGDLVMATFAMTAALYGLLLILLGFLPHMDWGPRQIVLTILAGLMNRFTPKLVRHYLVLPSCLLLQMTCFYLVVFCLSSLSAARDAGWLWEPFPPLVFQGLSLNTTLSKVRWSVVLGQWDAVVSLLSMLVLDLLTTLLPVELMTATKSIKMEEEFRTAGYSSLLAGLLWGNVSYISLSPTRLNHDAGGVSRESGLLSAGLCILWIFVGPELTGYVPKFVVGGMLCHLAFGYILEGLWDPRSLLSIGEYLIIVAMICYYLITDLAPAIFLGLALCSFSFILRYSQSSNLEFVKVAGEADMFSNRFRSAVDQHYLKSSRSIVVVRSFCSQLFFGTMASILAEVEPFLHDARFLLLDLSSLRTIDSSGLVGFQKIPPQIQTVLVCLSPELQAQVRRAGLAVCMFGSIDEGLEWCEDRTLKFRYLDDSDLSSLLLAPTSNNPSVPSRDMPRLGPAEVRSAVLRAFGDELLELEPLLLQLPVKKHEVVFHEGSLAEGLYIVVSGTLQIQYGNQRGIVLGPGEVVVDASVRRSFGERGEPGGSPGSRGGSARGKAVTGGEILCEEALYAPQLHSWSLVANVASILLLLRRDKLLLAEQRHPQAAIALHRCLMMSQLQKSGLWQGNTVARRTASM